MEERIDMDSVETVMAYLKKQGYDHEFKINASGLMLNGKTYTQDMVKLIRTFRFEGESDPSEEYIIYLIQTSDNNTGWSIDSYGMYSEHINDVYSDFIHNIISQA
jgi:hypothetical protein